MTFFGVTRVRSGVQAYFIDLIIVIRKRLYISCDYDLINLSKILEKRELRRILRINISAIEITHSYLDQFLVLRIPSLEPEFRSLSVIMFLVC